MVVRQVQGGMGLAPLLDLIHLDLAISQIQDGVSLARLPDPIYLDLAISQIQGSVGKALRLGNVPSPKGRESNTHTKPNAFGLGSQSSLK